MIIDRLFALQDPAYKAFHSRLMPTVDPDRIIGVRTPALRALAKEMAGSNDARSFLASLPHYYYEENNLHGMLIERMSDFGACIKALDAFLPHVDNWATCDLISPRVFKKHLPELLPHIKRWLTSEHLYTVRFGVGMLLKHYLDEAFIPEYLKWVASLKWEEYYVKMMVAWYFATALAKQWDDTLPYLTDAKLDVWTHNKTIQKAIESYRVCDERKELLKKLRIK